VILNNSYYQVFGDGKYSDQVLGRWTETNKEGATYPRLSTQSGSNNFQTSNYWLVDGDYIKLKNLELSYTLSPSVLNRLQIRNLKFFIRGTNLFTISKIKNSDPEDINAGVTKSPINSVYTGGISIAL
jgi:hypothetical protein